MLLARLRLGLRHLHGHNFKHSFHDLLNPTCNCGSDSGTVDSHYLLHCPLFSNERLILRNKIWNMNNIILYLSDSSFSEVLMFGTFSFNHTKNASILTLLKGWIS